MELGTEIKNLNGVGDKRAKLFGKLGIHTLRDLMHAYPRTYEDRSKITPVCELKTGEFACVCCLVISEPVLRHVRRGLDLVTVRVYDDTGALDVIFFNQPYVKTSIMTQGRYMFFGKVTGTARKPEMHSPIFELDNGRNELTNRIVPIYPLTAGLSQRAVFSAVSQVLSHCIELIPDILPPSVREEYRLCQIRFAIENIHAPRDFDALAIARRRLIFEELFVLSAALCKLRSGKKTESGHPFEFTDLSDFFNALPFTLTDAQMRAVTECAADLNSSVPMNRLLQGDVGSGKTVVGATLCYLAVKSGFQTAFMAPTEILASQHYHSLNKMLEPLGIKCALLKGSLTQKQKKEINKQLEDGDIDLLIGTHALLSKGVNFNKLGLAITDEQHRFGVNQRSLLTAKGSSPHILVMSATPIPRTLALIIYGDLDVTIIDELPPGRTKVDTYTVDESHRVRIQNFIRKLVGEGRQVYIVCPAVEESELIDVKAVTEYAKTLSETVFPDLKIGLVHGRLSSKDKDSVMRSFAAGEINILVATTVIEVGVDVPNAALIVVENADRFGLSQLHQLRGRVGRGEHKSYCILFNGSGGAVSRERLKVLSETSDGFKVSEEDLKLRGPGDFFGSRQHGLPEMKIATLTSDMQILKDAQAAALEVLKSDPDLTLPENRNLAEHISRFAQSIN